MNSLQAILLDKHDHPIDPVPDTHRENTYNSGQMANNSIGSLDGNEETSQPGSLSTESLDAIILSTPGIGETSQTADVEFETTGSLSDLIYGSPPVRDNTGQQATNFKYNEYFVTKSISRDTMSETVQPSLGSLTSTTEDFTESGQAVTQTFEDSTKTVEVTFLANLTRIDESLEMTQINEEVTLNSHNVVTTASIPSIGSTSEHVNLNATDPIEHTTAFISQTVSQLITQNETSSQDVIQTRQVTQTGLHNTDATLIELETLTSVKTTETTDAAEFDQTNQTNSMRPLKRGDETTENTQHETKPVTLATSSNEDVTIESALVTTTSTDSTTYTRTSHSSPSSQTLGTDSPPKLTTTAEYSERFTSDSFNFLSTSQSQAELSETSTEGLTTVWPSIAPSPAGRQMRIVIIGGAGLGALFVVLMLVVVVCVCRKRLRKKSSRLDDSEFGLNLKVIKVRPSLSFAQQSFSDLRSPSVGSPSLTSPTGSADVALTQKTLASKNFKSLLHRYNLEPEIYGDGPESPAVCLMNGSRLASDSRPGSKLFPSRPSSGIGQDLTGLARIGQPDEEVKYSTFKRPVKCAGLTPHASSMDV